MHQQLRPRSPLPIIEAEFFPSVAANHSATLHKGRLQVRVSDLFQDAPSEVLEALAAILLSKLYRRKVDPRYQRDYRQYTLRPEMVQKSREVRQARGRRLQRPGPEGRIYSLDALFSQLNRKYFGNTLRKPALSWTDRRSKSLLGRYEFDEDVIFVSRYLDSVRIPPYVVRYILFHEMLHVKYGYRIDGSREIVHPPEFRREEKRFAHYSEANAWLEAH